MPAETIGQMACPLCRADARVSLSKTGYPVVTCAGCHSQLFARSSTSDTLIRGAIKPRGAAPAKAEAVPATATDGPAPQRAAHKARKPKTAVIELPGAPPPRPNNADTADVHGPDAKPKKKNSWAFW